MATKGKITLRGASIGAQVGAILGGLTEGVVNLAEKTLKKGAEVTKKGLHEGREILSKGLEKTGESLSDQGIANRKIKRAEKTIQRAEELKKQYASAPKTAPKKGEAEIVGSVPTNAVTVHNNQG